MKQLTKPNSKTYNSMQTNPQKAHLQHQVADSDPLSVLLEQDHKLMHADADLRRRFDDLKQQLLAVEDRAQMLNDLASWQIFVVKQDWCGVCSRPHCQSTEMRIIRYILVSKKPHQDHMAWSIRSHKTIFDESPYHSLGGQVVTPKTAKEFNLQVNFNGDGIARALTPPNKYQVIADITGSKIRVAKPISLGQAIASIESPGYQPPQFTYDSYLLLTNKL